MIRMGSRDGACVLLVVHVLLLVVGVAVFVRIQPVTEVGGTKSSSSSSSSSRHCFFGIGSRRQRRPMHTIKYNHRTVCVPSFLRNVRGGGGENNLSDETTTVIRNEATPASNSNSNNNPHTTSPSTTTTYEIIDEQLVYSGWRTILQRKVKRITKQQTMNNTATPTTTSMVATYDLVGMKSGTGAVLIFAWDTRTKTATMIREYMPTTNRMMYGLAAGLVEADKHGGTSTTNTTQTPQDDETHNNDTILTANAARCELEEECHLTNGTWIPLLQNSMPADKYSLTQVQCYLVLDPEVESNPKPLDAVRTCATRLRLWFHECVVYNT